MRATTLRPGTTQGPRLRAFDLGAGRARLDLRPSPLAPRAARAWLQDQLPDVDPAYLEPLLLMTSELVANAVRHGLPRLDGKVRIDLRRAAATLRIEVRDGGEPFAWSRARRRSVGGHGLCIVDSLASDWGVTIRGRKAVWAEIDLLVADPADEQPAPPIALARTGR